MPRMKTPKGYYTLTEAKEKLNVSNAMVRKYVEKGKIRYLLPPGREHGFYNKEDVDNLSNELNAFLAMQDKTSTVFDTAKEEDVKMTVEITRILFGLRESEEATTKRRTNWIKKNPEILFALKSKPEEQVVGYAIMLPLKEEKIKNILDGTEYSQEVEADEIEEFIPGKPVQIYLMGIGVTPGLSHYEKRSYGARLVAGMMKAIINLGRKGITIEKLYGRSDTPDGIRLLRKMGFTEIPSKTHMRNFVVNIKESGIPFIQEYKRALLESEIQLIHRSKVQSASKTSSESI
jgi:ribosomal protein S18 acetylase RimI-like enzyme